MAVADVSFITYFAPIFAWLLVFVVMFALLVKSKILGESPGANFFVSFVIASLFVSAAGATDYVLQVTPWFAILLVSLFLVLILMGFVGELKWNKGIGIVFVILLGIVFLVSAFGIFSHVISPYLPGNSGYGGNPDVLFLTDWLYSPRVAGAILLIIVSAIATWVLTKK